MTYNTVKLADLFLLCCRTWEKLGRVLLCTDATTQQQGRISVSHDDEATLTSLPILHVQMKVILL